MSLHWQLIDFGLSRKVTGPGMTLCLSAVQRAGSQVSAWEGVRVWRVCRVCLVRGKGCWSLRVWRTGYGMPASGSAVLPWAPAAPLGC